MWLDGTEFISPLIWKIVHEVTGQYLKIKSIIILSIIESSLLYENFSNQTQTNPI